MLPYPITEISIKNLFRYKIDNLECKINMQGSKNV